MSFYERWLTIESNQNGQLYAHCPFHNDNTASFTINESTDAWYCHGCGMGGHHREFIAHYYDIGPELADKLTEAFENNYKYPLPTEDYVDKCCANMKQVDFDLWKSWGVSEEILKHYQIGRYDTRYIIPIRSRTGMLINVRKYLPPSRRLGKNDIKMIGWSGCNETRFYPYEIFDSPEVKNTRTIYIVEGEKDALCAISHGIPAVTSTGGSNIPKHEEQLFRGLTVYLMGDNDEPGDRTSLKYADMLKGVAKEVIRIRLPHKDYTECIMEMGSINPLDYIENAPTPALRGLNQSVSRSANLEPKPEVTVQDMSLRTSEHVENMNTWIALKGMSVTGVDPVVYTVPDKLSVTCHNQSCTKPCRLQRLGGSVVLDVEARDILAFVASPDSSQETFVKRLVGCKSLSIEPAHYINVQKIIFQESASFVDGLDESSFDPRYGMYLYDKDRLLPTLKYDFQACRVTDPRNQQNYYVINSATPIQTSKSRYTTEVRDFFRNLTIGCHTIDDLIMKHYRLWSSCLGIEQRADLFGAMLLTFLSVTEIYWNNGTIKGWLDTMVIGDTRTGKSQMAQRMVKLLEMGSYINGENSRRTGVIGGVQRINDSWIITWGAIPMNDMGLLVIDEASGLEVEDIKELSATRSSGAVTINKIVKGEARARTRLIWLSNPRSGRNIEDFYWKGYGAFQEFIPVVEDQARYDLVLSAAREDVSQLEGNPGADVPPLEMYRGLIDFAWNVQPKDITIVEPNSIKESVSSLRREFEGGPLFVGVAGHEKLLRISCAVAVLCGSIYEGSKLTVKPEHIKWAAEFLTQTYKKRSFDYSSYILENRKSMERAKENTQFVRGLISQYPALRVLLSANRIRGSQIGEILGLDRMEASKILSELLQRGLMKVSYNGTYQPDKLLVDITRQSML